MKCRYKKKEMQMKANIYFKTAMSHYQPLPSDSLFGSGVT